jgi:predicted transcriptional regulator of viral defense system
MPELQPVVLTPRAEPVAVRVRGVAETQEGVVTRRQLREAGLSDSKIGRWVGEGHLCRRHRDVYTLGHGAISQRGELLVALFYAGDGSALSHTTAGWWWRLIDTEPRRIHVSAPHNRRSTPAICVHSPRAFEVVTHRGLPVTTVARTLVDIAANLRFRELRRVVAEADFRGLASLREIAAECRRGRPGSAALRRALRTYEPELAHTRSELEERWVALCERYGIPMPEMNAEFCGLTVDALWRDQGVVVELDGFAAHASPARMEADRRRDLTLREAGFVVHRYTWRQITKSPGAVSADVLRALDRARSGKASRAAL